ncbi:uncharacterized protein K441DRAFT_695282 [Cenococcum geophilum 1.58]|uniref:uncharacterized protein n=1 Tax=Cenococcum geophilum 1.58 TaxID=794803 RepID=UPI00358F5ED4|nr:hypothetical protein K441DRAFT_695282 [Cenococcum geophilum 1.58]
MANHGQGDQLFPGLIQGQVLPLQSGKIIGQYQPRESTKKVCNFCFWVELRIACVLAEQRAKLCRCKWRSGWISAGIVFGPLPDRTHLSAIIWDSVENIRVYYQAENGDIVEEYKDGSFRRVVSAVAVNS